MNWTKFPNDALETLARAPLSKAHFKIFLAVLRETVGYGRESARLPLSRLAEMTGLHRTHVSRGIKELRALKMLEVTPAKGRQPAEISLAPVASWVTKPGTVTKSVTVTNAVTFPSKIGNPTVQNRQPYTVELKKVLKKDLKKEHREPQEPFKNSLRVPGVEETRESLKRRDA